MSKDDKEGFSQAPCKFCGLILPKGQIQCPRCWKPKGERHGLKPQTRRKKKSRLTGSEAG